MRNHGPSDMEIPENASGNTFDNFSTMRNLWNRNINPLYIRFRP